MYNGILRECLGPHVSESQSASLRQFGALAGSKLSGIVLFGWFGGAND